MSQKTMNDFFKEKGGKAGAVKKEKKPANEMEEEAPLKVEKKATSDPNQFPSFDELVEDLSSWQNILSPYTKTQKFKNTYTYVKKQYAEHTCYPPPSEIFNVFKQTPLKSLKVVIVGQDPYHQPGQAMGLCFSVKKGVKVPPSLANMYKSLESDPKISGFKTPKHGDLTHWANQGVFLLNDILTVEDSKPNAHKDGGWADFTSEVIKIINKECSDIVFLLWGAPAVKKASVVDKKKHHILTTTHPSPLSCHRGFNTAYPFSACNDILVKLGKEPIDWQV